MVEEAVDKLGEMTAKDARDYIGKYCAEDNVNELTISAQVIACSVIHPSAHHYPDIHRFLFYLGNGRYRRCDPQDDGLWEIAPNGAPKIIREIKDKWSSLQSDKFWRSSVIAERNTRRVFCC